MDHLPSELAESVVFTSDAPDLPPSSFFDEIPSDVLRDDDCEPPPPPSDDEYAADEDAMRDAEKERLADLNRKGVVIQHRLFEERPLSVFRSSSLPPG